MGWIDEEPGWSALRAELRVVRRRMRQRWLLTAVWALLVTAAVVGWKARQNPSYRASIVIRLVEDGFDEDTRPPTSRDITQYLYDIALSRPTLLSVIDEHGLYPEQRFDPTWAIESMKDDIDITVVSNYFSPETYIANPLREARVVIGYSAREPQQALDVVRELGELIAERESEVRRRIAELTARAGADAKSALRNALIAARRDHIALQVRREKTPLDIVQIRRLEEEIKALDAELKLLSLTADELSMRGELEQQSLGLRFEMVDAGKLPERRLSRSQSLAMLGLFVFFLSLPVVGVGVMALDTRIYDEDSLRRLGIASLGRIAPFRRAGSTRGRT
jgi:uncharacterized protein involved in exopolysaccharide biosynthesis